MKFDAKKAVSLEKKHVFLPERARDTHKYDYGKLLVIGGCVGYTGAVSLCAQAALRAGAGLVRVGVPETIYEITAVKLTEAMPFPLPADGAGRLSAAGRAVILDELCSASAAAVGCGLGRSAELTELVRDIIRESRVPLLLDADALFAVSQDAEILKAAQCPLVITPHSGEFSRLGGSNSGDSARDAADFTAKYGVITVLKGPETAIAFPDGEVFISRLGNPGMAKGGSGDVLAGLIAGLMCQFPVKEAVCTGVYLHGAAGDLCAQKLGEYSMLPTDMIKMTAEVMKASVK